MDKYEYQKRLIEKQHERDDEFFRQLRIECIIVWTIVLILTLLHNHWII